MTEQCVCLKDTNTWVCTYNTTKERSESHKPILCPLKNDEQCAFIKKFRGPYNFYPCLNTECDDYLEGQGLRDYTAGYAPCPKCEKDRAVMPKDP